MKKEAAIPLISVLVIGFASAAWRGFSIGNLIDSVGTENLIFPALFLLLTLFVKLALGRSKLFKNPDGTTNSYAGIAAALFSLIAIVTLYKANLDLEEMLSYIGLNSEVLGILVPIIIIIGLGFMIWKLKLNTLWIIGLAFIAIAAFTDLVYEKSTLLIIGVVFIILWAFVKFLTRKKKVRIPGYKPTSSQNYPSQQAYQQAQQQAQGQRINGINRLITEARYYRQWADQQQNPKMLRNWAHFINHLKTRGYGKNEKDICQILNITPKDIQKVVKKYVN